MFCTENVRVSSFKNRYSKSSLVLGPSSFQLLLQPTFRPSTGEKSLPLLSLGIKETFPNDIYILKSASGGVASESDITGIPFPGYLPAAVRIIKSLSLLPCQKNRRHVCFPKADTVRIWSSTPSVSVAAMPK